MPQNANNADSQIQSQPIQPPPPPAPTEVVVMNVVPINQTPPEAPGEGTTWRFSESLSNIAEFSQNSES